MHWLQESIETAIGPQSISEHERVEPIILGAGHGEAISKSIELLWI
ncbi:hypothetical protein CDS [Bradyrhizobium sp.]|nr:hypothetical protein CDS [Bradyrhizobium sp.]